MPLIPCRCGGDKKCKVCKGLGYKMVQQVERPIHPDAAEQWFPRSARGRINSAIVDMGYDDAHKEENSR